MAKIYLLMLVLSAFAAGGVFAQENAPYSRLAEGHTADSTSERNSVFTGIGGGISFDAGRTFSPEFERFWSQINGGPWGFVETRFFELSAGLVFGRVAQKAQWCIPFLAVNTALFFKIPVAALEAISITPLFGAAYDSVFWARHECVRSPAVTSEVIPQGAFRAFSVFKLTLGAEKDFELSDNRFFRAQVFGYYGWRLNRRNPIGGTLRLGFGRRLFS